MSYRYDIIGRSNMHSIHIDLKRGLALLIIIIEMKNECLNFKRVISTKAGNGKKLVQKLSKQRSHLSLFLFPLFFDTNVSSESSLHACTDGFSCFWKIHTRSLGVVQVPVILVNIFCKKIQSTQESGWRISINKQM